MDSLNRGSRGLQVAVWGLLAFVLLTIGFLFLRSNIRGSNLPKLGQVQPFTLTNQLGETVRLADLKGKVWVADVIFTLCPGPCPKMTEEMGKIQSAFSAREPLRFITLTTHPENDTPKVLKDYGEKFGADRARWHFLTGSKAELLRNLAIGSLKLSAMEKEEGQRENENDLFVHSTVFVLIDKSGAIRGFYESLEPGFQEKIRKDIQSLL